MTVSVVGVDAEIGYACRPPDEVIDEDPEGDFPREGPID